MSAAKEDLRKLHSLLCGENDNSDNDRDAAILQVISDMSNHSLETICNKPDLALQYLCRGTAVGRVKGNHAQSLPWVDLNGNGNGNGNVSAIIASSSSTNYENPIDVENTDLDLGFDQAAFERIIEIAKVDREVAKDVYRNCGFDEQQTVNQLLELQYS
mmetsp:Transcript_5659/g.7380  ORF Transcript_5659/g.7380 Transcript_5659/m.7380 type:complete len:159 (+) Transcript_5659:182-658(+)|eukprot:CAMPEP_0204875776 /NCGR_PEP_ID=MMETSP1348-20121228/46857_1 /ASSEMBLY_ACC=CAM_ASM_000700 /TAXON_ID=215587 /ORGANISM="Aplanochytrium stocchinoi, Strain GSBS06" /LENGTH=158 /DNA_ID=CAMNT_0052032387 /DNA_START=118 /DNA_END=594 /DNA_ORIENTATION=-